MDRELGGFDFNTLGDHCDAPPPVIEKWFKIGPNGVEFHGYEAAEIVQILIQMAQMGPTDSARWTPPHE